MSISFTHSITTITPQSTGVFDTDKDKHQPQHDEQVSNKSSKDTVSISDEAKTLSNADNELSSEEQRVVDELKKRDQEVKAHEQAHAAVGGQYAGAPSYEYQMGPDGKRYAVGGEVSIDVSEESSPEKTVAKMQIVRAAALAPAEPSSQDLKVAAQATQTESRARVELSTENIDEQNGTSDKQHSESPKPPHQHSKAEKYTDLTAITQTPSLDTVA